MGHSIYILTICVNLLLFWGEGEGEGEGCWMGELLYKKMLNSYLYSNVSALDNALFSHLYSVCLLLPSFPNLSFYNTDAYLKNHACLFLFITLMLIICVTCTRLLVSDTGVDLECRILQKYKNLHQMLCKTARHTPTPMSDTDTLAKVNGQLLLSSKVKF